MAAAGGECSRYGHRRPTCETDHPLRCCLARLLQINLCQKYPTDQLDRLRSYLKGLARFHVFSPYSEIMLATATPRRMRRLEQVLDNVSHLPKLALAAAQSDAEPSRG